MEGQGTDAGVVAGGAFVTRCEAVAAQYSYQYSISPYALHRTDASHKRSTSTLAKVFAPRRALNTCSRVLAARAAPALLVALRCAMRVVRPVLVRWVPKVESRSSWCIWPSFPFVVPVRTASPTDR